ncbi:dTDP-4-dehydrorhamnose 3,5-epimerase [Candidatus Pelagibacter sp.]|uniref:dTDP-4-dehydrorhamnose 3,5-epimerase n=1 Tax=Candidatus Pelagibacter sp. TaxID=2024849 RepID=UPI003F858017
MIKKTIINDLIIIDNKKYPDERGYFSELLRAKETKKNFPFIVMSKSKKNVLRGLHIQTKNSQGKYVSVIKGKIFDVVVDLRKNSKTFGNFYSCILSEKNSKSIFIPEGFAHGFLALDNENYIVYACTKYRNADSEKTIRYDDKDLKINWPIRNKKIIISKKDKIAPSLKEFLNVKK